jgi:hypothetical protein
MADNATQSARVSVSHKTKPGAYLNVILVKAPFRLRGVIESAAGTFRARRPTMLTFDILDHQARLADLRISNHSHLKHHTEQDAATTVRQLPLRPSPLRQDRTHLFFSSPPDCDAEVEAFAPASDIISAGLRGLYIQNERKKGRERERGRPGACVPGQSRGQCFGR